MKEITINTNNLYRRIKVYLAEKSQADNPPISASQSSGSVVCLELPLRKPLEDDSVTPLVKWSTSISTSLLREAVKKSTERRSVCVTAHRK